MNKFILILLFAGLLFLTVAGFKFHQEQIFIASSVLTVGEVKGYAGKEGVHHKMLCYPIIEYKDEYGQHHSFTPARSSLAINYPVGKLVEVYYLPTHPQKAKIKLFIAQWGDITGGILIGTLLLCYSGSSFIYKAWTYPPIERKLMRD